MAIEQGGQDEASSEAAMLALSAAVGDFCYRSDLGLVYRLTALPASTLGNWSVRPFRRGYGAFTDPVTGDTFIGRREELDHWNSAPNMVSAGVYTPTLTNGANVAASTAYQCQYVRMGSVVSVSGKVAVDPTLAATATELGISLPIASNFGAAEDCGGVAFATAIAGQGAGIIADAANDRASMNWVAADVTNQPMSFTFTYRVI
jgi:hypothetical protein